MTKPQQSKTETETDIKQLVIEFHEIWKQNGEPHPSSNAYLALNRAFFYTKGLERGIQMTLEMQDD